MSFIGGSSVNVTIDLSNVPNELPSQTGQAGKALVTNGSSVSWASAGTSLPTDGSTSVAYTTTNTTAGRTYGFKLESNTCGIAEVPYITTSDDTGARGVHVGYKHEQAAYGGGSVSVGYEALLPGFGVTTTTANAERTVAIGYQAGYNAHATTSSIFIGPYQGYAVSAARQLRIGNSGTPHPNSGYDKALLEGTFGTTDATQTFKINADAVYLGLAIPTTQPSDTRLWLNNGSLSIGAPSGGLSFTPNFPATLKRGTDRRSYLAWAESASSNYLTTTAGNTSNLGCFDGKAIDLTGGGTNNWNGEIAWRFTGDNAYSINEITIATQIRSTNPGSASAGSLYEDMDGYSYRGIVVEVYGSNDNVTSRNQSGVSWTRLNTGAGTWMEECVNNCSTFRTGNNLVPEYWSFSLYTNVNNYKAYKISLVPTSGTTLPNGTDAFADVQFNYLKRYEADYV